MKMKFSLTVKQEYYTQGWARGSVSTTRLQENLEVRIFAFYVSYAGIHGKCSGVRCWRKLVVKGYPHYVSTYGGIFRQNCRIWLEERGNVQWQIVRNLSDDCATSRNRRPEAFFFSRTFKLVGEHDEGKNMEPNRCFFIWWNVCHNDTSTGTAVQYNCFDVLTWKFRLVAAKNGQNDCQPSPRSSRAQRRGKIRVFFLDVTCPCSTFFFLFLDSKQIHRRKFRVGNDFYNYCCRIRNAVCVTEWVRNLNGTTRRRWQESEISGDSRFSVCRRALHTVHTPRETVRVIIPHMVQYWS